MLSQFRIYFVTVTVIIFILMVARIFDDRIQRFDISSSWPKLFVAENQTTNVTHTFSKLESSSFSMPPPVKHRGNSTNQTFDNVTQQHGLSLFFKDYKNFTGKDMTFITDGDNSFLQDQQYDFYQKAIMDGGLNITHMAMLHLQQDLMTPIEKQKLIGESIYDVKSMGDEFLSEVSLLNKSRRHFYVGEIVVVRIDIYNSNRVPMQRGGDEIRVWMKDQSKGMSIAVDVEDMDNGSYVARVPLLLPGNVTIFSSLAYPKEILRSIHFIRFVMKAARLNAGGFVSRTASETTLCSAFPIDYLGNGVCNLTKANHGRSWYCGKPSQPSLTCGHWNETRDMDFPYPLPMGKAEKRWFDLITTGKKHYLRALRDSAVVFKVKKRKTATKNPTSRTYCSKRPLRETWLEASPRGMFYKMLWIPFGCRLRRYSYKALKKRLKGYTIHLMGDSNLLSWMDIFVKKGLCTYVKNLIDKTSGRLKNWHDPTECVDHRYNFTVHWRTHTLPFHSNPDHWVSKANWLSIAAFLDRLPPTNKSTIILIHLYMHFTTAHHSVFADRIRATKEAIKRLLDRSPLVKVVIRGPHIAYKGEWPAYLGGDAPGLHFRKILREEFRELYDKVYLMDFWDMSIAGENQFFHPTNLITLQMIQLFFGYVIDE